MSDPELVRMHMPITHDEGQRVRFQSRARLADAHLVELLVEGIGRAFRPVCPLCWAVQNEYGPTKSGYIRCQNCRGFLLVVPMLAGEKGVYYVSIPWTE